MGIGTLAPDSSAILDMIATDKGLLVPRTGTNTVNAAVPAIGLLIYQTTDNTFLLLMMALFGSPWVQTTQGPAGATGSPGSTGVTGETGISGTTVLAGMGTFSPAIIVLDGGGIRHKNAADEGMVLIDVNAQCWKLSGDTLGNITTRSVACP